MSMEVLPELASNEFTSLIAPAVPPLNYGSANGELAVPHLNILLMVVGTWGDVQPFVALGERLQQAHGHRVRVATNSLYASSVRDSGLEFYPLGSDPYLLSAMMVKNRGFIPATLSDFHCERLELAKIVFSTWPACTQPCLQTGTPFRADAIIANPPAFGHLHCAQRLGCPLHLLFTMPWSPTRDFPHPFSALTFRPGHPSFSNWLSYHLIDALLNTGLIDIVNKFRTEVLSLDPLTLADGAGALLSRMRIPFSFAWSPSLTPKPRDWGPLLNVVGFMHNPSPPASFHPPLTLLAFLSSGPPPVYIGFGSMYLREPGRVAAVVFNAIRTAGVRAVVARGWAQLGVEGGAVIPPGVLLVDNVPHSWLFPLCSAVVHHGGAGTVAAGLRAARPTLVVPFFGDQHLWGALLHSQGLGPPPIPVERLTEEALVSGLRALQQAEGGDRLRRMRERIEQEDGVGGAVDSFHANLPLKAMCCQVAPSQVARLYCATCRLWLSAESDELLHGAGIAHMADHTRVPYHPLEWAPRLYCQPWHGLLVGVRHLAFQLVWAIFGVLLEPWDGWREGGRGGGEGGIQARVNGVTLGALRGVVGLVCRPILGAEAVLGEFGKGVGEWASGPKLPPWLEEDGVADKGMGWGWRECGRMVVVGLGMLLLALAALLGPVGRIVSGRVSWGGWVLLSMQWIGTGIGWGDGGMAGRERFG